MGFPVEDEHDLAAYQFFRLGALSGLGVADWVSPAPSAENQAFTISLAFSRGISFDLLAAAGRYASEGLEILVRFRERVPVDLVHGSGGDLFDQRDAVQD